MRVVKYFLERKKLFVLMVFVYGIIFNVIYNRYLKSPDDGSAKSHHPMVFGQFLASIWNYQQSNDTSTEQIPAASDEDESAVTPDVHVEHPLFGHTGEVIGDPVGHHASHEKRLGETIIAIGGGITSKGVSGVDESNVATKFQFFFTFLPTFCSTASQSFTYRFYLAFDFNDAVFSNEKLLAGFHKAFVDEIGRLCRSRAINATLHMVQCSHTGKPTWAQNDAMMEAYLDHVDYHYRINDDTKMLTEGWADAFVDVLNKYDPARVGVVGPNHSGGNVAILTYDFVHRTHVDIFGYYYPRLFTDWWGDDWVTGVYKPGRSTKLNNIKLAHTLGLGQRYGTNWAVGNKLAAQLDNDRQTLNRYLEALKQNSNNDTAVKPDGRHIVSMSLFGRNPRFTWGAIRNAQLLPVYLPGWTLRIYVADESTTAPELAVPPRIIHKLRLLGAEIARVPPGGPGRNLAPKNWRLLAANDGHLEYFLIRDADWRPSDREATAIREWIRTADEQGPNSAIVHCVRDHPKHADSALVDGLWGGRPLALRRRLRRALSKMRGLLVEPSSNGSAASQVNNTGVANLLNFVVWPAVANDAYCHDSVSPCERWRNSSSSRNPFPTARRGHEYVGLKYDEHQELISNDANSVTSEISCSKSPLDTFASTPGLSSTPVASSPVPALSSTPSPASLPIIASSSLPSSSNHSTISIKS